MEEVRGTVRAGHSAGLTQNGADPTRSRGSLCRAPRWNSRSGHRDGAGGPAGRAGGRSSSLCQESPVGATRPAPGAERGTGAPTGTPARPSRQEEEEEAEEEDEEDEEDVAGDIEDIPLLAGAAPRQQRRQQRPAREDEDGWEATATVSTVAAASPDARSPDLFERLQHAVSSLERAAFCRRRQPPAWPPPAPAWHRALQSLQELSRTPGWARRCWPEAAAGPGLPAEVAAAAARNASLRTALGQRDEELGQATAALRALRGERERLQGKVRDLREALAKLEEPGGSGSDTPGVGDIPGTSDTPGICDIPGTGDSFGTGDAPRVGDTPGVDDTPGPSSPPGHRPHAPLSPQPSAGPGREQEERLQQLQGMLARLQEANRELLAALGECKGEAERLSMELGRREARCSGLRLALSCSERCGGAYVALLDLLRAKVAPEGGTRGGTAAEPSPGHEPGPGPATPEQSLDCAPGPGLATPEPSGPAEPDSREDPADSPGAHSPRGMEEGALRELIRRLRAEQAAVEGSLLDAAEPSEPPPERDPRGRAERALREARALLPGWRRPEKEELLQELAVLKEALAELRTRLQLAQKEKRALELLLAAHGPREAALRLLLRERERERHRDWDRERDGRDGASGSSSGSSSEEEARMGRGAAMAPGNPPDPERTREELLRIRARTEQLRGRARELALALEQGSAASRAQQGHSATVTLELLQAHSSLALAYRGARRKQAEQLRRLQARAAALQGQHGRRERALARTLRELQRGGETCI